MNIKKYKLLAVLLAAILGLPACAGDGRQETQAKTETIPGEAAQEETASQNTQQEETMPQETAEQETRPEEEAAGEEEIVISIPELEIPAENIPDTEAMAFVKAMKTGWCLGNTLDAFDESRIFADELDTEKSWGNPAASQALVDRVWKAGFQTIRIPITWRGHVTMEPAGENGYRVTVSETWLDRVQEVVDYAYRNGMHVIINIHHDTSKDYCYPDSEHYEQSEAYITGVWAAVAERFKEYDQHLIFEAMNEPRLAGTGYEWTFQESAEECRDSADCINRLNQAFVDTVRKSGGSNNDRYLMIPGYSASVAGVMTDLFVLPEDAAEGRMIVSTHAYVPYNFALQAPGESGSGDTFLVDPANTREINLSINKLYDKFVSQGIPVVMGEYGARDKGGNLQARVTYYSYYVAYARSRGITCCVWDNGIFSGNGEQFGLFDRKDSAKAKAVYEDIVLAIMKYA